jgi:flagellar motor switch protein FliM
VVAISMEVRVGEATGMMNIGIPSMVVKALRDKFNQQWILRSRESTAQDQSRVLKLIRNSQVNVEGCMVGPLMRIRDLVDLQENDVIVFDFPVGKPLDLFMNGKRKYSGQIVSTGKKRAFQIEKPSESDLVSK